MRFLWRKDKLTDDARKVVEDMWGQRHRQPTRPLHDTHIALCFIKHYTSLLASESLVDGRDLRIASRQDAVQLVNQVKLLGGLPIEDVTRAIQQQQPPWPWLSQPCTAQTAERAITFAIRMAFFTQPVLSDSRITLESAVKAGLPRKGPKSTKGRLTADFSAKNLVRKGGMEFQWTSRLDEHLTFVYETKNHLRIFRHVTAIKDYCQSAESSFYPEGLLEEAIATMCLLYNPGGGRSIRRVKAIAKSENVDIEAQNYAIPSRALSDYPYWGTRLKEVQKRYNATKPKKITQWWYDRRDKTGWVTLLVAIVVFILTVIFGVISSVTSIMQLTKS